jgi:hypothetical protein
VVHVVLFSSRVGAVDENSRTKDVRFEVASSNGTNERPATLETSTTTAVVSLE